MTVVPALACFILMTLLSQSAVLRGRVVDSAGSPLPGATVAISGRSASVVTDAGGKFQIEGVPVGSHAVAVRLAGFRSRMTTFRVDASAAREPVIARELVIVLELDLGYRQDPVLDLRHHVERFAGAELLECGRHLLVQRDREWTAADASSLQKSIECGLTAASAGRAFWTFKQNQGVDSWMPVGCSARTAG
jgi:hypothetical protein